MQIYSVVLEEKMFEKLLTTTTMTSDGNSSHGQWPGELIIWPAFWLITSKAKKVLHLPTKLHKFLGKRITDKVIKHQEKQNTWNPVKQPPAMPGSCRTKTTCMLTVLSSLIGCSSPWTAYRAQATRSAFWSPQSHCTINSLFDMPDWSKNALKGFIIVLFQSKYC